MGEVFAGRYELLDLIGHGGMGSVWRVHDRRTDRVVAAKVLRQSDAATLLRFVRETAFRIQHQHVVTPLGWAGEDDRVLFTMPIVDGGSVATLVGDHGPLPAPFVAEVLRQLLDALSAVHASRVVHRDVKPANVLLDATGADRPHAYLTDFGIAVELDGPRLTETNVAIGTPGYMAPEQRRGEVTTASDLYAVGALAVHMLTAAPVDGDPRAVPRPEGTPDVLWALAGQLLADDPARRPDAATAAARLGAPELAWRPGAAGEVEVLRQVEDEIAQQGDLEVDPTLLRAQAGEGGPSPESTRPPVAPDTRPSDRSSPAPVRHTGRWVAGGVAAVAALVVAGVFAWSPSSGDADGGSGDDTATSSSSTSAPSSSSSTSSTSPSSEPTRTTGSVEVGTVVTRVGQPCEFSDVGLRERTTDGVEVICRQADDGYSWERPD